MRSLVCSNVGPAADLHASCMTEMCMQYLSISSIGVPESGGSLKTSSTDSGAASAPASLLCERALARAALRAPTSLMATASAENFVFAACMHASQNPVSRSRSTAEVS